MVGREASLPARAALPRPQPLVVKTSPVAPAPQDVEPKLHHGNYIGVNGFTEVSAQARRPPRVRAGQRAPNRTGRSKGAAAAVSSGPRGLPHVLPPQSRAAPQRSHTTCSDRPVRRSLTPGTNLRCLPCGLEGEQPCVFRGDFPGVHPHPWPSLWIRPSVLWISPAAGRGEPVRRPTRSGEIRPVRRRPGCRSAPRCPTARPPSPRPRARWRSPRRGGPPPRGGPRGGRGPSRGAGSPPRPVPRR